MNKRKLEDAVEENENALCPYELERDARIKNNERKMKSLGILMVPMPKNVAGSKKPRRQYAQSVINVRLARERHERGEPSSSFVGVTYNKLNDKGGKWQAKICGDGKVKHLGYFMLEHDAAKAYDDALVAQGAIRVNFPSAQEKAEQDDADAQLRANEKTARERHERGEPSSSFVGVRYVKYKDKGGKWQAQIGVDGKKKHLGYFMLEDDAAKAYDDARVAQGKSCVNFPSAQEKAEQDDADAY